MSRASVDKRRNERFEFVGQASWDYFAKTESRKTGYIINVSRNGCLFQTHHTVELRRWIRLVIQEDSSQVGIVIIGRVTRTAGLQNAQPDSESLDLFYKYLYGVEFTYPNYFSLASTEVISALSKRNLMARSCLNLNSKSPLRPGFLA